jgi:hypothetical protein
VPLRAFQAELDYASEANGKYLQINKLPASIGRLPFVSVVQF